MAVPSVSSLGRSRWTAPAITASFEFLQRLAIPSSPPRSAMASRR